MSDLRGRGGLHRELHLAAGHGAGPGGLYGAVLHAGVTEFAGSIVPVVVLVVAEEEGIVVGQPFVAQIVRYGGHRGDDYFFDIVPQVGEFKQAAEASVPPGAHAQPVLYVDQRRFAERFGGHRRMLNDGVIDTESGGVSARVKLGL